MALIDVKIPDIGDFENVPIVEILVKPGDRVKPEDPLLSLESDKAAMDVPAPVGGRIAEILAKVGDKVSEGKLILRIEPEQPLSERKPEGGERPSAGPAGASPVALEIKPEPRPSSPAPPPPPPVRASADAAAAADFSHVHAGPAVRRLARELGLNINEIKATGEKGRITKEDLKREIAARAAPGGGSAIPPIPAQDFAKFGPIERKPLSRLKKLSGPVLHRAWLNVPHVTHDDEADITELDAYRTALDASAKDKGFRVTLLAFLLKASVVVLKEHPEFNASLAEDKETLILKHYYHIGVAVDTPDGLVVPVIRDVDRKGVLELSQELSAVSARMRAGKITPTDIQGASFSISNLGSLGGTGFTPIVNAPEVAILGVARSSMKPVWDGTAFQPRLILPLCVSYDHRVIDGALAARFARRLAEILADMRQLIL
jgi:pyruvate dehydrogenase E2 component (dihydrolipoamide acetyltransferase)